MILLIILASCAAAAEVSPVPLPTYRTPAAGWSIHAGTTEVPVLPITVLRGSPAGLARMVGGGPVVLTITCPGWTAGTSRLLPERPDATVVAAGADSLRVTLPRPGTWTLTRSDIPDQALHLDLSAPAQPPLQPSRAGLHFGPGVHEVDSIRLEDGDTLWLDPGAVVRCQQSAIYSWFTRQQPAIAKPARNERQP